MNRSVRVTRFAQERLIEIAAWTTDNFGAGQSLRYRDILFERISQIADGTNAGVSCRALFPAVLDDLRFIRAGRHLVIYRISTTHVDVLDFLHMQSDLAVHLARLSGGED